MYLSQLLLLALVSGTSISSGVECANDECSAALSIIAKTDPDVAVYCNDYTDSDPVVKIQPRTYYSDELSDFEQQCKNDAAAIASACACWSVATGAVEILTAPEIRRRGLPIHSWRQTWDGSCGKDKWITCKGSRWGDCCSPFGWCGRSPDHCGPGCQTECGLCSTKTSTTPTPKHTTPTPCKSSTPAPTHTTTPSTSTTSTTPTTSSTSTTSTTPTTSSTSTTSTTSTAPIPVGSSYYIVKERYVPPMANALRRREFEDPSIRRRGGMLRSPVGNKEVEGEDEEKRKKRK